MNGIKDRHSSLGGDVLPSGLFRIVSWWQENSLSHGGLQMMVLCKSPNESAEIRCCVCGQGFATFWERQSRLGTGGGGSEALGEIQKTLRNHHRSQKGPEAHPANGFHLPERNGSHAASGVSILGHAPTWAL
jgi:hypothetical protein